jgi:lysophospholipase L1-like esterase
MGHHRPAPLSALLLVGLLACADSAAAPTPAAPAFAKGKHAADGGRGSEGRGVLHRYVAIGTSVSMGWRSDGVYSPFQETSWPAQLARLAHREISLPLIAAPGCRSPLVAPLAAGVRLSGEGAAVPGSQLICAPNLPGVVLPAQNVAINAAKTRDALLTTPENVADANNARLYARVLAPGQTQVTAMLAQNPKLVSVELGGNDLLDARVGIYLPGVTVVPVSVWEPLYVRVVDAVESTAKHGLLVGLVDDALSFPSFRRGAELWDARATFAPFNVAVSPDCQGSANVVFVPVRVPTVVATGVARARAGLPPAVLSCANAPSATGVQDFVLAPAEIDQLNAQLTAMNAVIRREAERRGFAYFALSALYDEANAKAPFNAVTLMTSAEPYGPLVSLDGVHPSTAGHQVLAAAAARALNATYGLGIPAPGTAAAVLARH